MKEDYKILHKAAQSAIDGLGTVKQMAEMYGKPPGRVTAMKQVLTDPYSSSALMIAVTAGLYALDSALHDIRIERIRQEGKVAMHERELADIEKTTYARAYNDGLMRYEGDPVELGDLTDSLYVYLEGFDIEAKVAPLTFKDVIKFRKDVNNLIDHVATKG